MLRGSDSPKRQQWTERLARYASADQTVAEFCRDEGVSAQSFYRWKRKLSAVNRKHVKRGSERDQLRGKPSAFKPLHVSVSSASSGVSVRLPDGIVIDLGGDLPVIEKVVAQLLVHQASKGTKAC